MMNVTVCAHDLVEIAQREQLLFPEVDPDPI
jgi:hypothetical protein